MGVPEDPFGAAGRGIPPPRPVSKTGRLQGLYTKTAQIGPKKRL